jgi:hypothetical protein
MYTLATPQQQMTPGGFVVKKLAANRKNIISKLYAQQLLIRVASFLLLPSFIFLLNTGSLAQGIDGTQSSEPSLMSAEEIKELKIKAENTYNEEVKACYQKFAVNNCKDVAAQKRIAELQRLRPFELKLNAQKRAEKAEQIEKDAQLKKMEHEQSQKEITERSNLDYQNRVKANQEKNDQYKSKQNPAPPALSPNGMDGAVESNSSVSSGPRAQYEQKQKEALEHKLEVQKRLEEKAKSKTPTQPSTKP